VVGTTPHRGEREKIMDSGRDVEKFLRLEKAIKVPMWKLWTAAILACLGVAIVPWPTEENLGLISMSVVSAVICLTVAHRILTPLWTALRFLNGDYYRHELIIRSELGSESNGRARLVELAQEMHDVGNRQNEHQKTLKTASTLPARALFYQTEGELSREFKELQARFYALQEALSAMEYNVSKRGKYIDYLFPEMKKETYLRGDGTTEQPSTSTPTESSWVPTVGEFPGDH